MTSTHVSKVDWKTYRIGCRIEKDADDRNYVQVIGQINGKDIMSSSHFNQPENVSKAMKWMMNYSLIAYLDGHHHETHYQHDGFESLIRGK